ncbi:MAG: tRNA adenosine(34) deaminase TadA [Cellvibrionales bacterium]|nr:MAG: tRNA adenosine(34) deaminase TadA [Cellvibrionales bacterium]
MSQIPNDHKWMTQAMSLARRAEAAEEVPVGAVLVINNTLVGDGWNCSVGESDPSAHAEIQALRAAAKAQNNYRLPGSTLYVTLEPCAMCLGAMIHARVERLVFAAYEPRAGAVVSQLQLLDQPHFNHRIEYLGGVMQAESSELLKGFFRRRRGKSAGS